MRAGKEREVK
jgi:hypothetical protein